MSFNHADSRSILYFSRVRFVRFFFGVLSGNGERRTFKGDSLSRSPGDLVKLWTISSFHAHLRATIMPRIRVLLPICNT